MLRRILPFALLTVALAACGEGLVESSSLPVESALESGESELTGASVGLRIRSNANVNVRSGASTDNRVLVTAPTGSYATVLDASPRNGFYKVRFAGTEGWSYGRYWDAAPEAAAGGGEQVRANANVNIRSGVGTSHAILATASPGERADLVGTCSSTWLRVRFSGVEGCTFGAYWDRLGGGAAPADQAADNPADAGGGQGGGELDTIFARAESGVGFSYWWGGAKWSTDAGADRGTCYEASFSGHEGPYGADCSGFVHKVWQVPAQIALTTQGHPYTTWNFYNEEREWHRVARDDVRKGDSMVHRTNGGGHIFLYERGDAWGSMWTFEGRSCDAGVVHNLRTASSSYRAIRKNTL